MKKPRRLRWGDHLSMGLYGSARTGCPRPQPRRREPRGPHTAVHHQPRQQETRQGGSHELDLVDDDLELLRFWPSRSQSARKSRSRYSLGSKAMTLKFFGPQAAGSLPVKVTRLRPLPDPSAGNQLTSSNHRIRLDRAGLSLGKKYQPVLAQSRCGPFGSPCRG